MDLSVTCTGLAKGAPPEPCVVVIFGVSGDLARITLVPSLYALAHKNLLPERFAIVGFARADWNDASFRDAMREYARKHPAFREHDWQKFAADLHYVRGDFTEEPSGAYTTLREKIARLRQERQIADNLLIHLSTPPSFYSEIAHKCAAASLLKSSQGWRRLMIEKPFGRDRASARDLDRQLREVLDEEHLYRVDHYLGKETVQNLLVFRFANPGFEPIWNRNFIDHVQITVAESEGIGTRGGYYDRNGVVRDMLQNHLLHLLCLTAMEPPVSQDGVSLRNELVKVLQAVRPPDPARTCVLGQYGAGTIEGRKVAAYRDEEKVPKDSTAPTFVAQKFELANWRWAGVPFYLRTGKRLPRKMAEIIICFKPTPHLMFPLENRDRLQQNILTFRLQPDEGIIHTFLAKQPGPGLCVRPVTMTFRYDTTFGITEPPSAYEWLLLDAMHGDQTLFPRADWIDRAWALVDPLIEYGEAVAATKVSLYEAGSWGPAGTDPLLAQEGRQWLLV